jgi:ribA/ribD-fused uncharacterized protein
MTNIYFYGGYLSNFHYCKFTLDGQQFQSSEQAFMYLKAKLMGDEVSATNILNASTPRDAKSLGRRIKPWNQQLWEKHNYNVMYKAVYAKFSNDVLKKKLLDTGSTILVEASPTDRIWGIGLSVDDALRGLPWNGQNLLGKVLMQVRTDLKKV